MYGKRHSRPGVFCWAPAGQIPGLVVAEYAQHFDPLSVPGQSRLEWISVDDLYKTGSTISPSVAVDVNFRANALAWCGNASVERPRGIIVAGCDSGNVLFFDAAKLTDGKALDVICARKDHQGHVMSVDISCDGKWVMSGGGSGQLLLWQMDNLTQPFSPGQPSFQDQVKCVRWNPGMDSVVASLSAHRCSIWDLRRHGAPIMDLAEVGGGVDWAELCWSPRENTSLMSASQSDAAPLLYKWDLRYPTAPVKEHRIHAKGISSIDWSHRDSRLMLSASHDHQILLSDPDSGDVHGQVGCEQDDWVRKVSWCPDRPDLLAVQYFQHPIQVFNVQSFGTADPETEQACAHLSVRLDIIPEWVSAPAVGARFSMGGRFATHSRHWDPSTNQWRYEVDIRRLSSDDALFDKAMQLQNATDSNDYSQFCEDKAHSTQDRDEQMVWLFLEAAATGSSRKEFLRLLGFDPDTNATTQSAQGVTSGTTTTTTGTTTTSTDRTNHTVTSVSDVTEGIRNMRTRMQSERSNSLDSIDELETIGEIALPQLNFDHIDSSEWSTIGQLISGDDDGVLSSLLANRDYATAFLLYRDDPNLTKVIIDRYLQEPLTPISRILSCVATRKYTPLVGSSPLPKKTMPYIVGMLLARERDPSRLQKTVKHLAQKWSADDSTWTEAALCSIVAHQPDLLLHSIRKLSLDDRLAMVTVLSQRSKLSCAEWDSTVLEYTKKMRDLGFLDIAWRAVMNLATENEELLDLSYSLWNACGGRERTGRNEPYNPNSQNQQAYASSLRPKDLLSTLGRRQSAPYNAPPGNSYQTPNQYGYAAGPQPQYGNIAGGYAQPGMAPQFGGMAPPPTQPPSQYGGVAPPTTGPSAYGAPPVAPPPSYAPPTQMAPPPTGPPSYAPPTPTQMAPPPSYSPAQQPYQQPTSYAMNGTAPPPSAGFAQSSENENAPRNEGGAWNDPPPLPSKKTASRPQSVMQVNWKPLDVTPAQAMGAMYGYPQPGMPPPVGAPTPHSFSPQQAGHPPLPQQQPEVFNLSPADQNLVDQLMQVGDAVLAATSSPAVRAKVGELKQRLYRDVGSRLATNKLAPETRSLLWYAGEAGVKGDYRAAQHHAANMVKTGVDFVEISSFLPALKSLFSQASTTFGNR